MCNNGRTLRPRNTTLMEHQKHSIVYVCAATVVIGANPGPFGQVDAGSDGPLGLPNTGATADTQPGPNVKGPRIDVDCIVLQSCRRHSA